MPQTTKKPLEETMFGTSSELKDFILWCQSNRIKTVEIGPVKVTFSDLAFIEQMQALSEPASEERDTSKTMTDTLPTSDEDELLLWSARS